MTKKINISIELLEDLYGKQKLSTHKIAKKFNCDPGVIQRRLKEHEIKLRLPKKKITLNKKKLRDLYINKQFSTYKIAKILGISSCTVYYKLKENKIKTRPKKNITISKEKLKRLYYNEKLSLYKIANLYNCSSAHILKKMKNYRLKRRDHYKSNIKYLKKKFTGNKELKAYMIGFRIGDLNVKSKGKNYTILIKSGTTKKDQYNLIKKIYGQYGHFKCKTRKGVYGIWCNMDKSFFFLVPKEDNIEKWILNNNKFFLAFLGGYTDAEGNIGVYSKTAGFRIRTYDKNIISQICNKLNLLNINARFGLASKKGIHSGVKHNQDCWGVSVHEKASLLRLLNYLKPYIKHKKRYNDLIIAEKNILERNKRRKIKIKI